MNSESHEPKPPALSSVEGPSLPSTATRHDGWTGDRMAAFCETLAETAVVAEACAAAGMGISGAYAARRRNPVFAAAWDAALTIARERLADTLLARSMEGNVEQLYKDGELIGERHILDNRLGLAILKRLDRLTERSFSCGPQATAGQRRSPVQARTPAIRSQPFDWSLAIDALRTGDDEGVARALALIERDKVEEVEDHHFFSGNGDEDDTLDLSDRCWWEEQDECWLTDFPPAPGFTGYESRAYDDINDGEPYARACTPEEVAALEADAAALRAAERAAEEELRDRWFELLRAEHEAQDPPPAPSLPGRGE